MDINFLFMALKGKRFSHLILDGNYPSHAFLGLPLIDKYVLFIKANDRVALGTERRGRIDKRFFKTNIFCVVRKGNKFEKFGNLRKALLVIL